MTISTSLNPRAMLADYENAEPNERACVNEAIGRVLDTFERYGFKYMGDDTLAEVEAVIFNYLRESN